MWKCDVCTRPSLPGQQRQTHKVLKPDGNIAREVQVCDQCKRDVADGIELKQLIIMWRNTWRKMESHEAPNNLTAGMAKAVEAMKPFSGPVYQPHMSKRVRR